MHRAKRSLSKDEENRESMRNHVLGMFVDKARRILPYLVCITYCSVSYRGWRIVP